MSLQADNRDWYLRVPAGYRVGGFEVTAPIAEGSFGSVYAARHAGSEDPDRTAALKFIAVAPMGQRQFRDVRESARREADFSSHAEHENIVTVFGSFVVDDPGGPADGSVVLAMELAEQSLQNSLSAGGPTTRNGSSRRSAPGWPICARRAGCTAT